MNTIRLELPMLEVTLGNFWVFDLDLWPLDPDLGHQLLNICTKFEDNPIGTANARCQNDQFWAFDLDFDLDDLDQGHRLSGFQMPISALVYIPSFVKFWLELSKLSLGRTDKRNVHTHRQSCTLYPPQPLRGWGIISTHLKVLWYQRACYCCQGLYIHVWRTPLCPHDLSTMGPLFADICVRLVKVV